MGFFRKSIKYIGWAHLSKELAPPLTTSAGSAPLEKGLASVALSLDPPLAWQFSGWCHDASNPNIPRIITLFSLQDKMATDIFGAHYDEGRITRVLDPDPTWGTLARRSIERYRDIEAKSGMYPRGPWGGTTT